MLLTGMYAKVAAESMIDNNESVQSYLIDSRAWDRICNVMIEKVGEDKIKNGSTDLGNYYDNQNIKDINALYSLHTNAGAENYKKGLIGMNNSEDVKIELSCGASDSFKIYNIYDMAGNLCEFTTETTSNGQYMMDRGGSCVSNWAIIAGECFVDNWYAQQRGYNLGFREVLYFK